MPGSKMQGKEQPPGRSQRGFRIESLRRAGKICQGLLGPLGSLFVVPDSEEAVLTVWFRNLEQAVAIVQSM